MVAPESNNNSIIFKSLLSFRYFIHVSNAVRFCIGPSFSSDVRIASTLLTDVCLTAYMRDQYGSSLPVIVSLTDLFEEHLSLLLDVVVDLFTFCSSS